MGKMQREWRVTKDEDEKEQQHERHIIYNVDAVEEDLEECKQENRFRKKNKESNTVP